MQRILFLDDGDISARQGMERVIHPARKFAENPVLAPERPWEEILIMGGTVLHEAGGYRMWYQSYGHHTYIHLYATSQDGIHWERPILRQYADFSGSLENNIFLSRLAFRDGDIAPPATNQDHIPNVLYTPQQGPERTYTLFSYDYGRSGYGDYDGFVVTYSRDGITWQGGPRNPVIPGHADVGWFMYDTVDRKFRGAVKQMLNIRGHHRRSVLATESPDGLAWSLPQPAIIPDVQDDAWAENYPTIGKEKPHTQYYGMTIFRYESMLIGFLQIFYVTDTENRSHDGPVDLRLVASRDGWNWQNVGDRRPILELGPAGSWDAGGVYGGNSLVQLGDEVRMYYSGASTTHGVWGQNAIGLASWPRDRLVGLRAGAGAGQVQTTLHSAGQRLHINAQAAGGRIVAEVLGADGQVIAGYRADACQPLSADSLDITFDWGRDPTAAAGDLPGQPVMVRLYVTQGEIFSLWWD